jgi:glycosyltransferase involved in cell wall biosynthesis
VINNPDFLSSHHTYKIAYCLPVFRPPDTTDTSIMLQYTLMEKLKTSGHTITLLAPKDLSDVICTGDPEKPQLVVRTWSRASWYDLTSKAVWRLQRFLNIPYLNYFSNLNLYDACLRCLPGHDIVQERIGLYKMGVAMACRRLNLPYIVFFDSNEILEHDLFKTPIKGVLRWRAARAIRYNLASASAVVCVSELAKTHLVSLWGVPQEKIVIFPNAVDVELFCPRPEVRAKVRDRLGVGDNPLVIFVGSFFPYQDIRGLLDAYATVQAECPQARLLLVGEGEQYADMVKYASSLGLDSSATFTGFLPHTEIPSLLNAADIAVAPYARISDGNFLGSSMKLVEYMASGLAVIASDNGQIKDVIRDGANGILVPAGDVNALAHAIVQLIQAPSYCQAISTQARQDILRGYSWNAYISRLECLFEAVINKPRSNPIS